MGVRRTANDLRDTPHTVGADPLCLDESHKEAQVAEETPADTGTSEAAQARQTIDTLKAEVTSLKENAVNLGKVRHVDRWVRGKGISDNATVDQ